MEPERGGVHLLFGHGEVAGTDVFEGVELYLLEADDLAVDADFAPAGVVEGIEFGENLNLGVVDGVGEVVTFDGADVGFAANVVELFDLELAGVVEIDGFFVEGGEGGGEVDFGDDLILAGDIDDDEVVAGYRAEGDGIGGVGIGCPVPGVGGVVEEAEFLEEAAEFGGFEGPELFVVADGEFEGGALHVAEEDFEVVGVDVGRFRGAAEEILGVFDDVLIERSAGGDEDGDRKAATATGATGTLPGGGDGAGVAGHDNGVEGADIDAEFEGVGGDDTLDFAAADLAFDFTAFAGEVAAPVATDFAAEGGKFFGGVL